MSEVFIVHSIWRSIFALFFFFNDTATTEIYTLSLHDALPISGLFLGPLLDAIRQALKVKNPVRIRVRSEEHTSELQSRLHLVCRLLLEKKKRIVLRSVSCNFISYRSSSR